MIGCRFRKYLAVFLALLWGSEAWGAGSGGEIPPDLQKLLETKPDPAQYPHATAVYLLDKKTLEIRLDGSSVTTVHQTIFLLNERGERRYAQVRIPYVATRQQVKVHFARTVRPDGTLVEATPEAQQEIAPAAAYSTLYPGVRLRLVNLPAVEAGAVVDYEYSIEDLQPPLQNDFWDRFLMQAVDPILLSKYVLTVPATLTFKAVQNNLHLEPEVINQGSHKTYVWQVTNCPPVVSEPYMPPFHNVASWLMISSLDSWDEVAAWYADLAREQYVPDEAILTETANLVGGVAEREEKIKALFYYVESKIRYVALELGTSAYRPHSASEVFRTRYGDCKDQATLLITMLRCAGIEAYPALVRKNTAGKLARDLPSPGQFNHALVCVPQEGGYIWLDTTAETCPYGYLPADVQGCEALIIKGDRAEFATTPVARPEDNLKERHVRLRFVGEEATDVDCQVALTVTGTFDLATRAGFLYTDPAARLKGVAEGINQVCPNASLFEDSFRLRPLDLSNLEEPLTMYYRFRARNYATRTRRFLLFKAGVLERVDSTAMFVADKRTHPVVFREPLMTVNIIDIELPPGYRVEELPLDVELNYPFAYFAVNYQEEEGKIRYTRRFAIVQREVPPEQYPALKQFYERVAQEDRQQIVLYRRRQP